MKLKFKKIWQELIFILVATLILFLGRVVNFNFLFQLPKTNNFLDLVFQLSDLFLCGLVVFQIHSGKLLSKFPVFFWSILIFSSLGFFLHFSGLGVWHFLIVFMRLIAWIFLLQEVFYSNLIGKKYLFLILIIYSFFDHFLLSNSLPIFIFYLSWKSRASLRLRVILGLWFFSNFWLALFQIIKGQSLGLSIFGEPNLAPGLTGIAKQSLFNNQFLRGYGLSLHPNILGFVALIGLFFSLNSNGKLLQPNQFLKLNSRKLNAIILFLNSHFRVILNIILFGIILFSFSRLALIGLGILLFSRFFGEAKFWTKLKYYLGLIAGVILLTVLWASRFFGSDFYRFGDLEKYWSAYQKSSIFSKLFGVGLGNYPFYLQTSLPSLESWQWQPVHNIWLNLFFEIGLLPLFLIIILCSKFRNSTVLYEAKLKNTGN